MPTWDCYTLWTEYLCPSSPQKSYVEGLTNVMVFGGGTFGRWLGHEDGAFMDGFSAFIKEIPESFFAPCENTEDGHLRTRNQALTQCQICWCLDLAPPSSRTVRKKFLLFISHPVCNILLEQRKLTKISHIFINIWSCQCFGFWLFQKVYSGILLLLWFAVS